MQPERLRTRIAMWAEEETRMGALPGKSGLILEAILYRGELPQGDAGTVLGTADRQARRIVAALPDRGVVVSESMRAPFRWAFPAALAGRWTPIYLRMNALCRPAQKQSEEDAEACFLTS